MGSPWYFCLYFQKNWSKESIDTIVIIGGEAFRELLQMEVLGWSNSGCVLFSLVSMCKYWGMVLHSDWKSFPSPWKIRTLLLFNIVNKICQMISNNTGDVKKSVSTALKKLKSILDVLRKQLVQSSSLISLVPCNLALTHWQVCTH